MDRPSSRGVTFRETMSGPFGWGETDPEEGARAGRARGTSLAMHAHITIPDIDAFMADASHEGRISGAIDFAPLGGPAPSPIGRFRLFAPATEQAPAPGRRGEAAAKLMVYELSAAAGGAPIYFAGTKLVNGGRPTRLWRETTTLAARLHGGTSASAPVVAAGVLRLSPVQFLSLITTLRGGGASRAADRVSAVLAFGRFFATEVFDSYVAPRRRAPAGDAFTG